MKTIHLRHLALATLLIAAFAAAATAQDEIKLGGVTERTRPVREILQLGPPANDDCSAPITLGCGDILTGSTSAATDEVPAPPTCGTSITAPGVWYSIQGNGGEMQVTTCFSVDTGGNTDYDTKLNVFTSDCGALDDDCIGGNDDGSPDGTNPHPDCVISSTGSTLNRGSTVTWVSADGQEYLVLVQGFNGAVGPFDLGLTCEIPVELTEFGVD